MARHVFVCQRDAYVVLLDLRQDRYFTVDASQLAGLDQLVEGWPASPNAHACASRPSFSSVSLAARLLSQGMLTTSRDEGKAAGCAHIATPESDWVQHFEETPPRVTWRHVLRFLRAALVAWLRLHMLPLERVVDRVARRGLKARQSPPADAMRVRVLVDVYARLRVFLYTHKQHCLFDSLVLLEYLALHQVFPRLVFGVRTAPFSAHGWVQMDDIVCNDTVGRVRAYTPILVV